MASLGGAGIYHTDSTARIVGCSFYKGNAFSGAGGGIEHQGIFTTLLTVQNCVFLGNTCVGDGGGISGGYGNLDVAGCFFSGNTAGTEGGAIKAAGDTQLLRLANCTFSNNSAQNTTGGVYASGGLDVQMYNSILWGNTGVQGGTVPSQQITTDTFQ